MDNVIILTHLHCWAPTKVKATDGLTSVLCVCGRLAGECKRHMRHRLGQKHRHEPGGYTTRALGLRGFANHGLTGGPYYSLQTIGELHQQELDEMTTIATDALDPEDEQEIEEVAELRREVQFSTPPQLHDTLPPPSPPQLHDTLPPPSPQRESRREAQSPATYVGPDFWYCLLSPTERALVTT
jgi:hypothetical protein